MTVWVYIQNGAKSETILSQCIIIPNIIDLAQVLDGKRTGEENLTIVDATAGITIP